MPVVTLRNTGDALRIVYDTKRNPVSVQMNSSVSVDLNPETIERLETAQLQGDLLLVDAGDKPAQAPAPTPAAAPPAPAEDEPELPMPEPQQDQEPQQEPGHAKTKTVRVRVKKKNPAQRSKEAGEEKEEDYQTVTPAYVLSRVDELDYHQLLSLTKEAVPNHNLGVRPTKKQMLDTLRGVVAMPQPDEEEILS